MAEPLKLFFNAETVGRVADMVTRAWPAFPRRCFVTEATDGLGPLELMDRGRHIMEALARALPAEFPAAAEVLERSLGPPLGTTSGWGTAHFLYLPHAFFVAERGRGHFEEAMRFQHAFTQRFSAEFSIRPYLQSEQDRTLKVLEAWTRDPSVHVRRLCSEGPRPRLPWASRLPALQKDPTPVLPILHALRDDPADYVWRSVANHLNDVGKDHPALLLDLCKEWNRNAPPTRQALVRHALRSLIKAGDARALELVGVSAASARHLAAEGSVTPRRVVMGDSARVSVSIQNQGKKSVHVVADVVVHYAKADGSTSPKVFKGRKEDVGPGEALSFQHTVKFVDLTTRRHHAGVHHVALRLNGKDVPLGDVTLRRP
jgi:3-methyladenine DNA glycosylase AlkC